MAKIISMEAARCFRCDTMIYAIEPVDDAPEFGSVPLSVTVCACCGHLMIVEHDLTLREPTTDELPHQSFDGWGGVQKMLKSSFNQHALADARAISCDIEPTADAFTQPNRYFTACRGFAPARLTHVSKIGLRIKIGQLLHL
jgi:hypothetical protein